MTKPIPQPSGQATSSSPLPSSPPFPASKNASPRNKPSGITAGGLPKDKAEWIERYKTSINMLAGLRKKGIAGGIYTQTTDVEPEINGLITYDRKIHKLSASELAEIAKASGLME
jgi:hypothetical protein